MSVKGGRRADKVSDVRQWPRAGSVGETALLSQKNFEGLQGRRCCIARVLDQRNTFFKKPTFCNRECVARAASHTVGLDRSEVALQSHKSAQKTCSCGSPGTASTCKSLSHSFLANAFDSIRMEKFELSESTLLLLDSAKLHFSSLRRVRRKLMRGRERNE